MSWSLVAVEVSDDDLEEVLKQMSAEVIAAHPDSEDQISNAVELVKNLIDSGCLGDESNSFNITLTGHANPNHEPAENMSRDMISISVQQAA